jgi:hypothetical protein
MIGLGLKDGDHVEVTEIIFWCEMFLRSSLPHVLTHVKGLEQDTAVLPIDISEIISYYSPPHVISW